MAYSEAPTRSILFAAILVLIVTGLPGLVSASAQEATTRYSPFDFAGACTAHADNVGPCERRPTAEADVTGNVQARGVAVSDDDCSGAPPCRVGLLSLAWVGFRLSAPHAGSVRVDVTVIPDRLIGFATVCLQLGRAGGVVKSCGHLQDANIGGGGPFTLTASMALPDADSLIDPTLSVDAPGWSVSLCPVGPCQTTGATSLRVLSFAYTFAGD